ncbi:MAG: hypothetical protein H3C33_07175 [Rhodocyclaceae bacterium]|nr:hypothetical protein [Rhodocyclaceae bacterium]
MLRASGEDVRRTVFAGTKTALPGYKSGKLGRGAPNGSVVITCNGKRPLPVAQREISGYASGNGNALKHGRYTAGAIVERLDLASLLCSKWLIEKADG